jgi:hypothetical protein
MNWHDYDISGMATQNVPAIPHQFQQRPQPAPYAVKLPAHKSARDARNKGLRHWLRYQRRSWFVTIAFVVFILLAEMGGLTLSLAVNNSSPGQSKLFPQTFPAVTPTAAQCIHETLYFSSTGQLQQTGVDETCR